MMMFGMVAATEINPIRKVVTLMQEMQKEVEAEGETKTEAECNTEAETKTENVYECIF